MATDVTMKDPNGTVPAFKAARELVDAMSPRFRKAGAKAVARRMSEYAKTLTKDGVVATAKAAKTVKAAKPVKAAKKTRAVKATKPVKPTRTLSPTRAVPKGSLTKNGKKRGRPFSKNTAPEPQNDTAVELVYAQPDEMHTPEHVVD